jgi:hypothetical protein
VEIGTVRETFFANCFEKIFYSDVGGKNKSFRQIKDVPNSFMVADMDYTVFKQKQIKNYKIKQ